MLQPWEAYQIYTALKLHFESESYDALKYKFKTSASQKSFLQRRDRFHFAKLARMYPEREVLIDFLVANFVHGEGKWAGDLLDGEADTKYKDWLKKRDSFTYYFTEQVNTLAEHCMKTGLAFDDLFRRREPAPYPVVIELCAQDVISKETVAVLDELLGFMAKQKVTETIFWPEFEKSIRKYRPFLRNSVDVKKCRQIALLAFTNAGR